ncbi:MAG: hypothetical protein RBG1_1C00001G1041 [candidate division Zixibacteria bacterium RBG-1]|nr:MAG: hypothetical protein RBG1_1C00001G1041 [candidate division Zixibacteria bacterium RBG-1]OGC85711.1 MAG: hypothetical protein A2V73_01365 [candidate division Zixibacteria bacterium RBG_19FT_COMBO_42_43]
MRKIIPLTLGLVLLVLTSSSQALTGLGFGIRGGLVQNYDNPALDLSGVDLSRMQMIGGHLNIGTLRIIDLEVSAEYAWKKKKDAFAPTFPNVDVTIADLSLNGTAKYKFNFPVIRPFVGLGLGWHRLVYSSSGPSGSYTIPDDENTWSWQPVGGVGLHFPAVPFEIFLEGRYTSIQTSGKNTNYTTIIGGLTFNLP